MNEIILEDDAFIVSQTDLKGNIIYANNDFKRYAGYTDEELIGKAHNIVRHPDMPKAAFGDLWQTISRGETWEGFVKNRAKSGAYYWVYAIVGRIETIDGREGYLSCRIKPSRAEVEKYEKLYETMRG